MAALPGLRTLLLSAAVFALASPSPTSPARTTHASTVTTPKVTLPLPPSNRTHASTEPLQTHPDTTVATGNVSDSRTHASTEPLAAQNKTHPDTTVATGNVSDSRTHASTEPLGAQNTTSQTTTPLDTTSQTTTPPDTTSQNTTAATVASASASSSTTPATPSLSNQSAVTQPPAPKCDYTLIPIKFGLRVNVSVQGSRVGTFTITLRNERNREVVRESAETLWDVDKLNPCTKYTHSLSFNYTTGFVNCNHTKDTIIETQKLKREDLEYERSDSRYDKSPKRICYKSRWDLKDVKTQKNVWHNGMNMFCINYDQEDVCTNFTTNISTNCNFSLSLINFIDLAQGDIEVKVQNRYPTTMNTIYPPNCKNWSEEYTCSDNQDNSARKLNLTELEPYKPYTCAGTATRENVSVSTREVHVKIECDLRMDQSKEQVKIGNSSLELHWTLKSSNCEGDFFTRFELSGTCHCNGKKEPADIKSQNVSCQFSNLDAYTNYRCQVHLYYNKKPIPQRDINTYTYRTLAKKPEPIKVTLSVDRNNINVDCSSIQISHGPETRYIVRLLEGDKEKEVINSDKRKVQFKGLSYSTTYTVKVSAFNGEHESTPTSKSISTMWNEKPLIGFLVFLIVLTSMALIFVAFKIYILRRKRSRDPTESMILIPKTNDEDRLIFVEPVTAERLLDIYKMKIADEGRLFLAEFQSIPRIFSKYSVKEAKKNHNGPKNRYVDILPYDYNRVQLSSGNSSTGCDYINASFIDGFKEPKKYIAAQGPKEETVSDFWRMVWEQQSSIIVMVSRCEEGNRVKCAQYWPSPDKETEIFEEFVVKLTSEDHYPDYIIRHLSIINKKDKTSERDVTHIQFMSWPDHGVPEEAHLLLKLRRRVNSFKNFFSGPIVIHCSAGVGRTGTYMSIDAMMESLEAEGKADIYGYVVMLRRQRCLMVQVEAQYILIHQALLEHTQFGETESPLQELHCTLSTLRERSGDDEPTLMEEEFDRLPNFRNWRTFNIGTAEENKKKNRTSSVIPYDYNRVLLKHDEGQSHESDPDDDYEMSTDDDNEDNAKYINASLLSGYWGLHAFIAAQTPLPHTAADFWSMVLQNKVPAIVMLSDCGQGDEDCLYWGEGKKTFEDIEVEVESTESFPTFALRNMTIHHWKKKTHQQVKHFQFLKWGNRELPEKPQDLADLIKEVKHRCCLTWSRSTAVVAHCNDGSSRSGVFCALWNLLDSAEKEKAVDVFQVVKTLRKERQRMLSSLEQYQFLYDALEVHFPVQNGDVKAAQNSVQIVSETSAAERPASTTSTDQQEAAQSAEGDGVSTATEEASSNSPTVTVEV